MKPRTFFHVPWYQELMRLMQENQQKVKDLNQEPEADVNELMEEKHKVSFLIF